MWSSVPLGIVVVVVVVVVVGVDRLDMMMDMVYQDVSRETV